MTLQATKIRIFKIKSIPKFNNVNLAIDLIIEQQSSNNDFLSNDILSVSLEDFLTENIDKCFDCEKFCQLNFATIHRIIYKCDNKKALSDELLNFIKKSIDERYLLFSFIEIKDLSDENLNELYDYYQNINNPNKEFYFKQLSKDFIYIKKLSIAFMHIKI